AGKSTTIGIISSLVNKTSGRVNVFGYDLEKDVVNAKRQLGLVQNVLFKISFPAEFHSQTAVEAAMTLYEQMQAAGKTAADIEKVT
ncbi:2-methylcitrate dehydratase, partial [Salmonella enterica subsp. enterica serovar Montevideo]|nr:2-methylcitrate dehydratase [Salmonella enterica subsp. enterica serovar Montevideo]